MLRTMIGDGLQRVVEVDCLEASAIGPVWVAVSAEGLVAVEIGGEAADFQLKLERRGYFVTRDASGRADGCVRQIGEYLAGERRAFDLPVDWAGMGAFQRAALEQVIAVPYGQTATYGEVARRIGKPGAARAVGRANATNPLPLVIPCHRLVGTDGKLHGYGAPGGIETKRWLLELERGDQTTKDAYVK